jgi:hypothetical protein
MRLPQEDEAILAAAAHYFTAVRGYSYAIDILECCQALTGYPQPTPETRRQLDAVNKLTTQLFTGYPKAYTPDRAQLAALRSSLRKLRKLLVGKIKKGRPTKTIYQFLQHVERRPGMYLRQPTMEQARVFIDSVLYPVHLKLDQGDPPFRSFPAWVDRRYPKHQGGGHAWDQVLVNASGGDQQKALKLFFKEIKAFRRSEKGA